MARGLVSEKDFLPLGVVESKGKPRLKAKGAKPSGATSIGGGGQLVLQHMDLSGNKFGCVKYLCNKRGFPSTCASNVRTVTDRVIYHCLPCYLGQWPCG